jgi:hypothetical protein
MEGSALLDAQPPSTEGDALLDVAWWQEKFQMLMYPGQNAHTLAALVVETLRERAREKASARQREDAA